MKMVKIIESMYFLSNKLTEYVHIFMDWIKLHPANLIWIIPLYLIIMILIMNWASNEIIKEKSKYM